MPSQRSWPFACVLIGMAVLALGCIWPAIPVVAAMGLVLLGATAMTTTRSQHSPVLVPMVILHISIYAALYGIFVGAALHAAQARTGPQFELFTILDIMASVAPVVFAGRLAWNTLWLAASRDA